IPSNTTPISYVHCGPFSLFVKRASLYSESIAVIAIFSDNAFSCPKPSCINSNKQLIIPICILIPLLSLIFNFSLHYCTVNAFSDALCINALTSPTRHHQYSSIYYLDIFVSFVSFYLLRVYFWLLSQASLHSLSFCKALPLFDTTL